MTQATMATAPQAERAGRKPEPHHSSLYGKRLPKFEANRSYEDYAKNDQRLQVRTKSPDAASAAGESASRTAAATAELTLEEQTDKCLAAVGSQRSLREILYKLLVFCEQLRTYADAEQFLLEADEYVYSHVIQSPAALIQILVGNCGLIKTPLDESGLPVSAELLATLDADEADDIVAGYTLETTEAGRAVAALLDPAKRLAATLARNRGRTDTFTAILRFCHKAPRKFPEIKAFYDEHAEFDKSCAVDSQELACDYYVDKLEAAGMLVWRGRWEVTEAGEQALAELGATGPAAPAR